MRFIVIFAVSLVAGCAQLLPGQDSRSRRHGHRRCLSATRAPASEQKAALARAQLAVEKEGSALTS